MGVREIDRFLEQWQMDARDLHRRMILAPIPRERERWHAVWLLAQGWTASATAEALERYPHTIGRWAAAFGEGGGAGVARHGGHGTGQLELEGGPSVCLRTVGHQPVPQQLPELPAPFGIRPEASQEAAGQG